MELGLREWLLVIGLIVIAGILFDGWRRMSGGKGKLKFRLDHHVNQAGDEQKLQKRTPRTAKEPELSEAEMPALSAKDLNRMRGGDPRQGDLALSLDEPVPTLLNPVEPEVSHNKQSTTASAAVDEVLVINVVARGNEGFKGPALLQNILESGLRFGEMDIFHRHENMAGKGEILFSMANALKPGIFDLDDIEGFSTRAVSFFIGLPGPVQPKQAFELMVTAARKLAHELNGELKDDQRSVMTAQTIEHYRQRIAEFERRKMTGKR